ncbi:VanW family protein [Ornithinibacillus halotolerans]|uniref:Peptidoglycan binding domain-containing protein n=1 Tax=Ornithinibacillus halotolerans TaxID=1274357 RepID=A0A916S725_9BACI|nr:VanW family protein [Ornithinibacillus halotolerans]GGA87463.1 hypothetical protein GCM10008025_32840 [Ornithinibacillus halotolerans]
MKKFVLFILFLLIPLITVNANQLIISHNNVNETIIREDFALHTSTPLFINEDKLDLLMKRIEEQVYEPPINAKLDESWSIIPGKNGQALDKKRFKQFFYNYFYSDVSFQIKLPMKEEYPKVDSELLADIRMNEIGNYVTYYRQANKERSHNIKLAADAIDNHVVFPGETFSFNHVVGKRTIEKGYKRAPVIVKGELSEDIGGGICQVSSTLFNALLFNGIKIVERYSHSRDVPYVPPGKDATVSWWGPDFVFRNELSHPILIRAQAMEGKMIIRIFTSDSVQKKEELKS